MTSPLVRLCSEMNPTVEALLVLQARDVRAPHLTAELEDIPNQIDSVANDQFEAFLR